MIPSIVLRCLQRTPFPYIPSYLPALLPQDELRNGIFSTVAFIFGAMTSILSGGDLMCPQHITFSELPCQNNASDPLIDQFLLLWIQIWTWI